MADQEPDQGIQPGDRPRPRPMDDYEDERADDDEDLPQVARPNENRALCFWVHWGAYLTWILVPIIFYTIEKDKRSLVAWHAREALNFQISIVLYMLLTAPLLCLAGIDLWLLAVPCTLFTIQASFELIVIILASIAAMRGQRFHCPLTIPFVRAPRDARADYVDDLD